MTYGALRYRLQKLAPGIDLELLDGWIQDRCTQILDALPWRRLEAETVLQWPQGYTTGTATLTQDDRNVLGVGTAWTADMSGMMLRVPGSNEYYFFNYSDSTHATLDRAYEGVTGSDYGYRLDWSVAPLPSDFRILRAVRPLHHGPRIEVISQQEMNRIAPQRTAYGSPRYAAASWDTWSTDPPVQQIELYPIPSSPDSVGAVLSFAVDYIAEVGSLDASQTGANLWPWVRANALVSGVSADIALHKGNPTVAMAHEAMFDKHVATMAKVNAMQIPAEPMRMAPQYIGGKCAPYHRGPWHRGFPG